MEKTKGFQKSNYFHFTNYAKVFDCVEHNKLWKILKGMGIPDCLTCSLKNLYVGQEKIIRTRHGMMDCFKVGKGVCQSCVSSLCLFNFYAEYITWNVGLNESQAATKIVRRYINSLRCADDSTLKTESEEELKCLSMRVKEKSIKTGVTVNDKIN